MPSSNPPRRDDASRIARPGRGRSFRRRQFLWLQGCSRPARQRDRADVQDLKSLALRLIAATTARLRVNGVALFGGACVEAEATHAPHVKGQEVSAACSLNVADIFDQQRRFWVRLHEKGGRFCEMPCHHTLEGYLGEYIERARLAEAVRVPLFQAIKYRPTGAGRRSLSASGSTASTRGPWSAGMFTGSTTRLPSVRMASLTVEPRVRTRWPSSYSASTAPNPPAFLRLIVDRCVRARRWAPVLPPCAPDCQQRWSWAQRLSSRRPPSR